jgi:hypothetical protein
MAELKESMRIDCHVHSYPLFIPGTLGGLITKSTSGISIRKLEGQLKKFEDRYGVKHGVFYGGNDFRTVTREVNSYLESRVLPMIENHVIQLIGVAGWDSADDLEEFCKMENQIDAIKFITSQGGLAIIDQPRVVYERKNKKTNRVFLGHKGEATIQDLLELNSKTKERTFLSYNGMSSSFIPLLKTKAEEVAAKTRLRLIGGSDSIINQNSMFSSYSVLNTQNISEVLAKPDLIDETHKRFAPIYHLERIQRVLCAGVEELMGLERRERKHEVMIRKYFGIGPKTS